MIKLIYLQPTSCMQRQTDTYAPCPQCCGPVETLLNHNFFVERVKSTNLFMLHFFIFLRAFKRHNSNVDC